MPTLLNNIIRESLSITDLTAIPARRTADGRQAGIPEIINFLDNFRINYVQNFTKFHFHSKPDKEKIPMTKEIQSSILVVGGGYYVYLLAEFF